MNKKKPTFQHPYDAHKSPELQDVLVDFGVAGIGIYWCIIEQLYENEGLLSMRVIRHIAFALHADEEMVRKIICETGLFEHDTDNFWSEEVLNAFREMQERRVKRRNAANKRWGIENSDALAMQQENSAVSENKGKTVISNAQAMHKQCTCNALALQKEEKQKQEENEERTKEVKEEKKIKEENFDLFSTSSSETAVSDQQEVISPKKFMDFWNLEKEQNKAVIPELRSMNGKRPGMLSARIREHGYESVIETVRYAMTNDFLNGKNDRGWIADFDWLFAPNNFQKALEKKYVNRTFSTTYNGYGTIQQNKQDEYNLRGRYETRATSPDDYEDGPF